MPIDAPPADQITKIDDDKLASGVFRRPRRKLFLLVGRLCFPRNAEWCFVSAVLGREASTKPMVGLISHRNPVRHDLACLAGFIDQCSASRPNRKNRRLFPTCLFCRRPKFSERLDFFRRACFVDNPRFPNGSTFSDGHVLSTILQGFRTARLFPTGLFCRQPKFSERPDFFRRVCFVDNPSFPNGSTFSDGSDLLMTPV